MARRARSTSTLLLLASGLVSFASAAKPLPLVIWHGLGDNFQNPGLQSVADLYTAMYPGASTHIIGLADDADGDRKAGYWGALHEELAYVCEQLSNNPDLASSSAPYGVHALGFSQGGLFMRGYVEMCNHVGPKVHTLVTFGSPHNGIAEFVKCKPTDWLCHGAFGFLNANKWSGFVQNNIVPAQYYRHPGEEEMAHYLESSGFLADINNEREAKNDTYRSNLANMDGGMVLYSFDEDEVIIPPESVWMAEVAEDGQIEWLTDRKLYKEEWLGFKALNEAGKIKFLKTPGMHMRITDELLTEIFAKYLWQPDGVAPLSVDASKHREALASLALPFEKEDRMPIQVQGLNNRVWR